MNTPDVDLTDIPGLLILKLHVQHNDVGWFKEDWHREKMGALGLPDFRPVQQNLTHNDRRGITRGFHAEPWDRLITVVAGRAMGAWVDLRSGAGFGKVVTHDLDRGVAVFVPRGVANAHQILQDDTTLSYLMNHHWTPEARSRFTMVNLFDPALDIAWPVAREDADLGRTDVRLPYLEDVSPVEPRRILVVGTETQLGRCLTAATDGADGITAAAMDPKARAKDPVDLSAYDTLVNARGSTGYDSRRTSNESEPWAETAEHAKHLADIARRHRMRYVQVSADCDFDRSAPIHSEDASLSLLSPHSRGLAMAEVVATTVPRHLIIRTGWVVGDEDHGIADMVSAARLGRTMALPSEQHGRLTFINVLAAGMLHLIDSGSASGTYNLTGEGPVVSWLDVGRRVFELCERHPDDVGIANPTPDDAQSGGSILDLARIRAAGFRPGNSWLQIEDHVSGISAGSMMNAATRRPRFDASAEEGSGEALEAEKPFRVLFVCTANICRSAYADVIARGAALHGIEFLSAGTRALVGEGMDPPMAVHVGDRGDADSHVAQQLTSALLERADLVLTMTVEHRRFILEEMPASGRKTFLLGHVAREMTQLPDSVELTDLVQHLWRHRSTDPADEVADPHRRGEAAAEECCRTLERHVDALVTGFTKLIGAPVQS